VKLPDNIVLVLGGGNALGAYHAGAYEALDERGIEPGWIAGASIGAVNGAIIAGNRREDRLARLRDFWRRAEQFGKPDPSQKLAQRGPLYEKRMAAMQAFMAGRPGLFAPRLMALWSALPGVPDEVSLFDTAPLLRTLRQIVDFEALNGDGPRLTITAVDVETGEDVFFDTRENRLEAEHIRASAAFPVAYPPVAIDGRMLVDPGLSANLPLRAVFSEPPESDTLCIAVDLLSASGRRPRSLGDAAQRAQDLVFATQSRHAIRTLQTEYRLRELARRATGEGNGRGRAASLPTELTAGEGPVTILHVAYAEQERETAAKMFDYSEASIRERWSAGHRDMVTALERFTAIPEKRPPFAAYRLADGELAEYR
jgi:NTE family protein